MVAKTFALICIALGALALLSSCGGSGLSYSISTPGHISANIIDELQPGTTLHMVGVHYQRHGPAEEILKESESYQPETLRDESWTTFDASGKLSDLRTEQRTKDGKMWVSSHVKNGHEVFEGHTPDFPYSPNLSGVTVDSIKKGIQDAIAKERAAIAAQPHAPVVVIRGTRTRQLEDSRRALSPEQQDISPGNYVSVYTYDLHPVEEIRREYVLPDGSGALRSETVVVDSTGKETVVESEDDLAFEVLKS